MPATQWKMPPLVKVYEALGAIGDGRVRIEDARRATVTSSDGSKSYEVETSADGREIASNDNASYWQGYLGYPAVAVLLTVGALHADGAIVGLLAGVPWHELNARFKRDYDAAVDSVLADLEEQGADRARIVAEVDAVMAQLAALELQRPPRRRRPPPGG
jgi:hypothetical protein